MNKLPVAPRAPLARHATASPAPSRLASRSTARRAPSAVPNTTMGIVAHTFISAAARRHRDRQDVATAGRTPHGVRPLALSLASALALIGALLAAPFPAHALSTRPPARASVRPVELVSPRITTGQLPPGARTARGHASERLLTAVAPRQFSSPALAPSSASREIPTMRVAPDATVQKEGAAAPWGSPIARKGSAAPASRTVTSNTLPVSDDARRGRAQIERASGEIQFARSALPSHRHELQPARSTTARAAGDAGVVHVARREAQPPEHAAPPAEQGEQPAEHGDETHEDEHGEEHGMLAALFWPTLNFLVLFGGLWYLLKQPLASYLKSRHETIRKDLVDAAALKAAATAQLEEIDRKLAALPAEIAALKARGAEEIAAEEARIAAEAAAERERLLEQTRREIDLQLRLARRALVEHAADLAVGLAADRIQQQITSEDQERLAGRYVAQIAPPA